MITIPPNRCALLKGIRCYKTTKPPTCEVDGSGQMKLRGPSGIAGAAGFIWPVSCGRSTGHVRPPGHVPTEQLHFHGIRERRRESPFETKYRATLCPLRPGAIRISGHPPGRLNGSKFRQRDSHPSRACCESAEKSSHGTWQGQCHGGLSGGHKGTEYAGQMASLVARGS